MHPSEDDGQPEGIPPQLQKFRASLPAFVGAHQEMNTQKRMQAMENLIPALREWIIDFPSEGSGFVHFEGNIAVELTRAGIAADAAESMARSLMNDVALALVYEVRSLRQAHMKSSAVSPTVADDISSETSQNVNLLGVSDPTL